MNEKLEYILNKYYKYFCYRQNDRPYTLGEKGDGCENIVVHDDCCALNKKSFLCLTQLINVTDENALKELLCLHGKGSGNEKIRLGDINCSGIKPQTEFFISVSILALFTHSFHKNPALLQSLINVLLQKNIKEDEIAKEFVNVYIENDFFVTYKTDLGVMIGQMFLVEENDLLNIKELEKEFLTKMKTIYQKRTRHNYLGIKK